MGIDREKVVFIVLLVTFFGAVVLVACAPAEEVNPERFISKLGGKITRENITRIPILEDGVVCYVVTPAYTTTSGISMDCVVLP